jgi:hypothetical protein
MKEGRSIEENMKIFIPSMMSYRVLFVMATVMIMPDQIRSGHTTTAGLICRAILRPAGHQQSRWVWGSSNIKQIHSFDYLTTAGMTAWNDGVIKIDHTN